MANTVIAQEVGLSQARVVQWRQRFAQDHQAGLEDCRCPGRKPAYTEEQRARVVATVCGPPPDGATHWTVRSVAERTGVGRQTVHRILRSGWLPIG